MPKKTFVINNLTEAKASEMKHMQILAKSKKLLTKVVGMVKDDSTSRRLPSGCRISTRAMRSVRNNRYPVVTCRVKFADSPTKGQGKKLTLPCHMVMMLDKLRKQGDTSLWSFDDGHVVNHNCHESRCYRKSHLSVTAVDDNDNNSKSVRCFGYVECGECGVRMCVCSHQPTCIPVKTSTCTNCKCE